jgi:hypothetical protein
MRRTLIALALVLAFPAGTAIAQTFGAVLTASQEVPPTTSPGSGNATVSFTDATHTAINVTITVTNLGSPINAFHIHGPNGPAGTNANIAINLQGLGGTFVNNKMTGTFPIDATNAAALLAHPENFYVNVHTNQFGGGAIRGNLAPVSGTIITYAADLKGSNENPPTGSNAVGSAIVTVDTANNTVTWNVVTNGIASPTLAHIHGPNGSAGTNANVFIPFATSAAQIPGGRTSGSVTLTQATDLTKLGQLIANPSDFYVNVHSTAFGTGEIRGQLVPANEVDVPVAGAVGSFVTDVRVFNPSFTTTINGLVEYFPAGSSANTTAANSIAVNIPPRGTAVLNNVNGTGLLNSGSGIGGVRVSSAEAINVTSKIFSDQRSAGKGTFGQFLPGLPRGNALRRGVLPQLENDANFRTNIGFFNPNTAAVTVRLELRDENSNVVATSVQTFQPLSQQQNAIGNYFPNVDLSNKANLTLSFDASAPMDIYAAINDNVSADSFVVVAQEDTGVNTNS